MEEPRRSVPELDLIRRGPEELGVLVDSPGEEAAGWKTKRFGPLDRIHEMDLGENVPAGAGMERVREQPAFRAVRGASIGDAGCSGSHALERCQGSLADGAARRVQTARFDRSTDTSEA